MRGTISAGMALALDELGLVPAFDAVYGAWPGHHRRMAAQPAAGAARLDEPPMPRLHPPLRPAATARWQTYGP